MLWVPGTPGFKSRALRVGGEPETPAAALAAAAAEHAAVAAAPQAEVQAAVLVQLSSAAASHSATAEAGDDVDPAAGRKRRAAVGSIPSPSVSPKLAAAVRHGQQCRVQPGEEARREAAADSSAAPGASQQSAAEAAPDVCTSADDDSVTLVGSKLAAKLSQDRGTPTAARKGRDTGKHCHVMRV
jgi:hypothetical protein